MDFLVKSANYLLNLFYLNLLYLSSFDRLLKGITFNVLKVMIDKMVRATQIHMPRLKKMKSLTVHTYDYLLELALETALLFLSKYCRNAQIHLFIDIGSL